jgi:putative spermidine/putrescine transport system substrate-binding protein
LFKNLFKKKLVSALALTTVAALSLGVGAPSSQAAGTTIRLYISADTNIQDLWEKTLIPAFTKDFPQYDVKVTFDRNGANDAQTLAKITAAVATKRDTGMDLIDGGISTALGGAGLLFPLSYTSLIPNLKNVPKVLIANGKGAIPYRASTVLMAYNSKNVKTPPKTLAEVLTWIKANPGKFTYNAPSGGGSGYSFVQTVLDSQMTAADTLKLQTAADKETQAKWAKGWEILRGLNKFTYGQNGTYPTNNAGTLDVLAKGLVDLAPVWSDQIASALKAGTMPKDIKYYSITGPSLTGGPAFLSIPASATNRSAARTLVNWVLTPAAQSLIVAGNMNGLPVIPTSKLEASVASNVSSIDITTLRPGYFSSNASDLRAAWAAEVPGK